MIKTSPARERGLHNHFIKKKLHHRIRHFTLANIHDIGVARTPGGLSENAMPDWFEKASSDLQQQVRDGQKRSRLSNQTLAKTLAGLKGITEFAQPLLEEALQTKFGLKVDVNQTYLYNISFTLPYEDQSLLQLALRNFEESHSFTGRQLIAVRGAQADRTKVDEVSVPPVDYGWKEIPRKASEPYIINILAIKPAEFATLCRDLDIGKRYQEHLKAMFDAPDRAVTVRAQTIEAWKDSLKVHAHIASLKSLITPSAYSTLLAVLNGDKHATLDGERVTFSQLHVLGSPASEMFVIGASRRKGKKVHFTWDQPGVNLFDVAFYKDSRIIVCIPGDPIAPVKEYATLRAFESDLASRLAQVNNRRSYVRLIPHGDAGKFLNKVTGALYEDRWNPKVAISPAGNAGLVIYKGAYESVLKDDPSLDISESFFDGDLFDELYRRHQKRLMETAEQLAVPTAKVDHDAWIERLTHYATWGLDILNVAAFFVPGLGEVMMAVMAVQLGMDVYHGIEDWSIGDMDQAWGYLKSVGMNLAFMAVLGAVASKAPKIASSANIDGLVNVKLPFGDEKLWRPSLAPYKSEAVLPVDLKPNQLGQYEVNGKTYVRLDGEVYEKTFDSQLNKWRLKHPTNSAAYPPVLEHNGQGAWRHGFERPLEWDRATLLRRLGYQVDGFDDATLGKIADISGVDAQALRKVHVDNAPMPSALSDTLLQFRLDRQVNEMIEQVRLGQPVSAEGYSHTLAQVIKMQRWPQGRVIEVFEQADLSGASTRHGEAGVPPLPSIKISRAQVAAGKLPGRILSTLDEQEVTRLLGGEGARVEAERETVFGQQLAETLSDNKPALLEGFRSAAKNPAMPSSGVKELQRTFPGLSDQAAQELLTKASVKERLHIRQKGRLPASLVLKARSRARLGRLNNALTDLQLGRMESGDSRRLALHALEKQPGWSGSVRLEIREGSRDGKLLDAIGSESAKEVKYLVKDGHAHLAKGHYQAFDQYGEALNSVPKQGDCFFSSVMHALPDEARNGLGLPHVGQSAELQEKIITYVSQHRQQMMETLVPGAVTPRFRPPVRVTEKLLGYPMSGRGLGVSMSPSLISRVRNLYPVFTDEEAEQMIARQMLSGRTQSQIVHLLNNRAREYEALCATLDSWVDTAQGEAQELQNTAQRIKNTWQARGIADGEATSVMMLNGVNDLPELPADFSHVSSLGLDAGTLLSQAADYFPRTFPNAKYLDVAFMEPRDPGQAAEKLASLTQILELSLFGYGPLFEAGAQQMLSAMPQLERLTLLGKVSGLDVSAMSGLRSLTLAGDLNWPQGVMDLMHLNELDLVRTSVTALPEEMFTGHENLWRGLKVNWSALEPEQFTRAFEHVSGYPGHLRDVDAMVENYCRNLLQRILLEDSAVSARVLLDLSHQGVTGEALVQRFTQLHREELNLERQLKAWHGDANNATAQDFAPTQQRRVVLNIKESWLAGLRKRYGGERPETVRPTTSWYQPQAQASGTSVLDLSGSALGSLPKLPEMPGSGFGHVQTLQLSELMVPAEEFSDFLQHFPNVQILGLSGNQLTVLPESLASLGKLTELNLARNQLLVSEEMQTSFNRLTALEQLNLQLNRVGSLDVTKMPNLHTLRLGRTAIKEWPTGVLDLAGLRKLDLSRTAITTIPAEALTEAYSQLVDVSGCALTPKTRTDLLASTSTPRVMGIDRNVLLEGRTGGAPEYFPPLVSQNPELLIQLPLIPAQALTQMTHADRLMRLDSLISASEAAQRMEVLEGQSVVPGDVEAKIARWEDQHQTLTQTLNAWIEHPPHQVGGSRTPTWVSALERRRAADQLLTCWRQNLRGVTAVENGTGGYTLDFSSTPLASFPKLAGDFAHVGALKLNRVYLTEQGLDGFAEAFSHIHTLELDFNQLANLPGSITSFRQLKRLSVAENELITTDELHNQLSALTALESLNLGLNELSRLDVTALTNLRELDLHHNSLVEWPVGALQSSALRTLNLSNNMIETLPELDLMEEPSELMRGINITDNSLDDDDLNELGAYLERTGVGLGYTPESLDRALRDYEREFGESEYTSDGSESGDGDDGGSQQPLVDPAGDEVRDEWIDPASEVADELNGVWSDLKQAPGSRSFFKVLQKLLKSPEFKKRAGILRSRVQSVLRAARDDEPLRGVLFRLYNGEDTCIDGFALLFSDMEVKVYEAQILESAAGQDRAQVLFQLGRAQFRLDRIEMIARDYIALRKNSGLHLDEVEILLAFRTQLADRLQLPGQFRNMAYVDASHVTSEMIDEAYTKVIEAGQSAALNDALVQRNYWADYLKAENQDRFKLLKQEQQPRLDALEEQYPQINEAYLNASTMLGIELDREEMQLLIELSAAKVAQLNL